MGEQQAGNKNTKQARKVALINVADYPREKYAGYWDIHVDHIPESVVQASPTEKSITPEAWTWAARIHSRQPVGWHWKGKVHKDHPADVPKAADVVRSTAPDIGITQEMFVCMNPEERAKVQRDQQARRQAISKIHGEHPQAVHVVAEKSGKEATRDAADTAAQKWVIEQMKPLRIPQTGAGTMQSFAGALAGPIAGDMLGELARWIMRGLLGPMLASLISYATALRTSRMTAVRDAIDAGSGPGLIRIYNSTRPATGGSATTLGAELTCSDPSGTISSGVLTLSAITADSSADNSITASWFRVVDSAATFVLDGNVGTSGSDLNVNTTTITAGVNVSISSFTLTDGSS